MSLFTIQIMDANGVEKACDSAEGFASLVYRKAYQEGDVLQIRTTVRDIYVRLQLDDAMGENIVYLTGDISYPIPSALNRTNLSPKAFSGQLHYLFVRELQPEEIKQYRNQARNIYDKRNSANMYPHICANVESRGEAKFAASNTIDGVCENRCHGVWPYQSWGIDRRDDACLMIDFGHEIEVNRIVFFIRADFPHDNWWKQVTVTFSDGTSVIWKLEKTRFQQTLSFPSKTIHYVRFSELIKSDDPSPFPSLTQVEVYGRALQ